MTKELADERGIKIREEEFEKEFTKHQRLSKTASAGKFKSGLADNSKETTQLHTAAHLLDESIRKVLGKKANQRGSNITSERLRYDFSFGRKLTEEEKKQIEEMVNEQILNGLKVSYKEMTLKEAKDSGAVGVFDDKYGENVKVYTMGNFSKEICSGPHVENTNELGKFRITKETSSSSGVRRIKAVLE
jgi:alanyl-tRNA synthetase